MRSHPSLLYHSCDPELRASPCQYTPLLPLHDQQGGGLHRRPQPPSFLSPSLFFCCCSSQTLFSLSCVFASVLSVTTHDTEEGLDKYSQQK
uniref:Uncharacterized protein n=1 Tax=Leishmania guyanensis TaxID=5670 RepID=A0A1E1IWX3_LEIGU|nr:Hypothetical protein BN36_2332960 [Leishmania guyanensis]